VIGGLFSVLNLLGGLALLGAVGSGLAPGAGGELGLFGIVAITLAAIRLVLYYGLWKLEYWAWALYLIIGGLSALIDVIQTDVISLVIGLAILAYVYSKRDLYEAESRART